MGRTVACILVSLHPHPPSLALRDSVLLCGTKGLGLEVNGVPVLAAPAPHCSGDGRDRQCLPQGQTAEAYRKRPSPDAERGMRSQEKHGKKRKEAEIFPGSAHRVVPFLYTEIPGQEVQVGG